MPRPCRWGFLPGVERAAPPSRCEDQAVARLNIRDDQADGDVLFGLERSLDQHGWLQKRHDVLENSLVLVGKDKCSAIDASCMAIAALR